MPHVMYISGSGTGARRTVEEMCARFRVPGSRIERTGESATWGTIIADRMGGSLFGDDERTLLVVEDAARLGPAPLHMEPFFEPEGTPLTVLLVYEQEPGKNIPKELMPRIKRVAVYELPRFGRERTDWIGARAHEAGLKLSYACINIISEQFEDAEEIRQELQKLRLFGSAPNESDIARLCMGDNSRALVELLDSLCRGDAPASMKALSALMEREEVIPVLVALHNRFRLAMWGFVSQDAERLLKSRPYAYGLAQKAAKRYGSAAVSDFATELIAHNIREKQGRGTGWPGLTMSITKLLEAGKR